MIAGMRRFASAKASISSENRVICFIFHAVQRLAHQLLPAVNQPYTARRLEAKSRI
jgi:hypothetical protein